MWENVIIPYRIYMWIAVDNAFINVSNILRRSFMIFIIKSFRTIVFIFSVISTTFLRWSLRIFIIKGFRTIVFIFVVTSTTFPPICPPAFFRCLSNTGTYTELQTTSFIESTGVACFDSINWVQVLRIPVLLLAYDRYAMCPAGHIALRL